MSIRERVRGLQSTMLGEMTPALARTSLVHLTGLQGLAAEHLRMCELAYKHVLSKEMSTHGAATRARVVAETSVQFADFREARDVYDSITQMIVSCRAYLRSLDEEMRLGAR